MNIQTIRKILLDGQVIPACPLALDTERKWSERCQRALVRYYHDAGAGGLAVGVHSTQFSIRDPEHGLFEPVLQLASNELDQLEQESGREMVRIAGVCGDTPQAIGEAELALESGYHAGLVSLAAFGQSSESEALEHSARVAETIPVVGFYLQPAVGGRVFSFDFWRQFCEIENVVAIKVAPFDRYQTIDVVRAVVLSGRNDIALYTGNDDHIIGDLITPYSFNLEGDVRTRYFDGGLLGQWGVWTKRAVEMLEQIKLDRHSGKDMETWLQRNIQLTDANAAIFDSANGFRGCIPGILEVLRRVGLVEANHCLDPAEVLSHGQSDEIDRVIAAYPDLSDDDFVRDNINRWLP